MSDKILRLLAAEVAIALTLALMPAMMVHELIHYIAGKIVYFGEDATLTITMVPSPRTIFEAKEDIYNIYKGWKKVVFATAPTLVQGTAGIAMVLYTSGWLFALGITFAITAIAEVIALLVVKDTTTTVARIIPDLKQVEEELGSGIKLPFTLFAAWMVAMAILAIIGG